MEKNVIIAHLQKADIPFVQALTNSHRPQHVQTRAAIIQLLYWHEHLNQQQIASLLNTTQATISRLMHFHRKNINNNPHYTKIYNDFNHRYVYT